MDFSKMTDAELSELNKVLDAEITKRREVEKELAIEELKKLLDRVNELQNKYNFEISCCDVYDDWIDSAHDFEFRK